MDAKSPWGSSPPRQPRPGAGRAALAKRARARGGRERSQSPKAARRALGRGKPARAGGRLRGTAAELRRMSRLVEQKFVTRQRLRHVALALAGIWILWTFALGDASLPKLWQVKSQNDKLTVRIDELRLQAAKLEGEVRALESPSGDASEWRAREELGYVRDGEVLVRFYGEDD